MQNRILVKLKKIVLLAFVLMLLSSLHYVELNPVAEATNSIVRNGDTDLYYAAIQEAINANETLDGHNLFLLGDFYEHVVLNKSVRIWGTFVIGGDYRETLTTIDGNGTGTVVTVEADNVELNTIKITNGINGTVLKKTNNCTLQSLMIVDNVETGIALHNSRNFTLEYCEIAGNLYGIYIQDSNSNTFNYNHFINNTYQVHIEAIDGYPSNVWDDCAGKGNYWSDYEERYPNATEIDVSGIWNTPYVIDENNQDNYPIVPEFPTWTSILLILIVLTVVIVICKRRLLKTPIH